MLQTSKNFKEQAASAVGMLKETNENIDITHYLSPYSLTGNGEPTSLQP